MSLISYVNSILNDDLTEIGLKRQKGLEWYKIVDNSIYVNVLVRNTRGILWLHASARSLLSPLNDSFLAMDRVDDIYMESLLREGKTIDQIFLSHLIYNEDNENVLPKMKTLGHEMIGLVKPVLAGVHDLQSCYYAQNMLGYLNCCYIESRRLGRDYKFEEHTVWPPLDCFFMLCKMGRYDAAADYIRRELANYERIFANNTNLPKLLEENNNRFMPYVSMAENGEYEKINEIMLKNYNENCDYLEAKHRIRIDRSWFDS